MEQVKKVVLMFITGVIFSSFTPHNEEGNNSLTVNVTELRNSIGVVQFTLYNKEGSIPDDHFKKYYKQLAGPISDNSSEITFTNLPNGIYAVNILHDENENGKIDKGWLLPIEGVGFSKLKSINPLNRPSFKKTKFDLSNNKTINVSMIYM